jgi:hypothetical protein
MMREELFEGSGLSDDHHVAAIFDRVEPSGALPETLKMSHGR